MATVIETTSAPDVEVSAAIEPIDLTVDLVERMVEAGILPEDSRIFLQNGRLYQKMAKSKADGSVGAAVNWEIARRLPAEWKVWPEATVVLDPRNAPLPDFTVIRSGDLLGRRAPERYPEPRDVGLVIEVAVTSLRSDLTASLELYARAMIPAYWVVDVNGLRIAVHTEPRVVDGRGEYAKVETYRPGQAIPLVLDGNEVGRVEFDAILR
jgi:Uma2 family endonuclease